MKKINKILAVSTLSILFGSFAMAQESEGFKADTTSDIETISLTIEQAVDYALRNSRTLKIDAIDLEIKKRAADVSWNTFLPSVNLTGTMMRSNEYNPAGLASTMAISKFHPEALANGIKTDFESEKERWKTVGGLNISWNFSAAMLQNIKVAKKNYEIGQISWEQSQKDTVLNIRKLFYGLLLQQENLKIQKATLENKRQRMVQSQTSYKNGALPEIALLQTQVDYQNTKPTVDSASMSMNQSLDMFAFLLGLPVGTKIELSGDIKPRYVDVTVQELLDNYSEKDLTIQSLQKNIEVLKLKLKSLDLSTWTPALAVSWAWQPAYLGDNAFAFPKDLGKDDKWYDSGSLNLTLAWNLTNMLPWSSNRQSAQDLKANIQKLELNLETLKEKQKVDVRKAVDTLNQAKMQIDAMGRNVTLAQRAYDSTYKQYKNGQTELLNLRDAENSLNQAKLGLLNQKFEYVSALMDLENTLNTTLE